MHRTVEYAPRSYTAVAKFLHWFVLALLVIQFAIAWTMPDIGRGTQPIGLVAWHLSVGTLILAVMVIRLGWRLSHPVPPPPSDLHPALRALSRGTHYLLYLILFVLPLLGWASASSRGWPIRLLGNVPLPKLAPTGWPVGHVVGDIHATLAIVLLAVVALHVAGALYHAFVLKDGTVRRMLPHADAEMRPAERR